MKDRELDKVLRQILKLVPTTGYWEDLHHMLNDVISSVEFASPETMEQHWQTAASALEDELGKPPYDEEWMDEVYTIFTGQAPAVRLEGDEPLSWVCPDCHHEGDLRCTLAADKCPWCGAKVQATSYVTRDEDGKVYISQDWVNASGRPDEGFTYVVRGVTGEWSGRTTWPVRAFNRWEDAKVWAISAELRAWELCKEHGDPVALTRRGWWTVDPYDIKGMNEFDPKMRIYGNGVKYYVEDIPLEE